jgi:uncharacterized protein
MGYTDMKRDITKELISWKEHRDRYPLIIRGARQVGKSYIVEAFAKDNFKNTVVVNFEFQPQLKDCFKNLDPVEIINKLQLFLGDNIDKSNTLLFLDEIQECPEAIVALRYFKEKMPSLPVIGAGSLLEFALKNPDFKMPVGRVHFLYLEPLSFSEFLMATGNKQLREYLFSVDVKDKIEDIIHQKLLELLRLYLILGGMPAVVKDYIENRDLISCRNLQTSLLQTYRVDFGKYARTTQHKYLQKVFDSAPRLAGQRIKYSTIDEDVKSRDLKNALMLLQLAGVIKPVYMSSASGLPLGAAINEKKFKLNFIDTGLMQNACGLQSEISMAKNFIQINSGSVAEQFVGQELRAYSDSHQESSLFFWARDQRNSSAEVDYVINAGSNIFPLEVKAGKAGTLKSLRLFLKEKKAKFGIRISQNKLSFSDNILSLPLYMVEQIPRIIAKNI